MSSRSLPIRAPLSTDYAQSVNSMDSFEFPDPNTVDFYPLSVLWKTCADEGLATPGRDVMDMDYFTQFIRFSAACLAMACAASSGEKSIIELLYSQTLTCDISVAKRVAEYATKYGLGPTQLKTHQAIIGYSLIAYLCPLPNAFGQFVQDMEYLFTYHKATYKGIPIWVPDALLQPVPKEDIDIREISKQLLGSEMILVQPQGDTVLSWFMANFSRLRENAEDWNYAIQQYLNYLNFDASDWKRIAFYRMANLEICRYIGAIHAGDLLDSAWSTGYRKPMFGQNLGKVLQPNIISEGIELGTDTYSSFEITTPMQIEKQLRRKNKSEVFVTDKMRKVEIDIDNNNDVIPTFKLNDQEELKEELPQPIKFTLIPKDILEQLETEEVVEGLMYKEQPANVKISVATPQDHHQHVKEGKEPPVLPGSGPPAKSSGKDRAPPNVVRAYMKSM